MSRSRYTPEHYIFSPGVISLGEFIAKYRLARKANVAIDLDLSSMLLHTFS
ncbi:hypothetical protein [Photorhabdus caribbeanensis]|uniref:hypothetical protein n=1 Tax=Photorhabdus caribbeanensis TaxID=1004165 RepID=UPI001BD1EC5A|nr:hypothetical protein [Photorhabdus caribbeanensis]